MQELAIVCLIIPAPLPTLIVIIEITITKEEKTD